MAEITTVLRQPIDAPEGRSIAHALMVDERLKAVRLQRASVHELIDYAGGLAAGTHLPIGSVQYVRAAMAAAGVAEPPNLSYPDALMPFLCRHVSRRRAGAVLGRRFVKPTTTKAFTGFVYDTLEDPDDLDPHDREQHDRFMALGSDEMVWVSEPVAWLSEVRYYLHRGLIIGQARYDADGADDAPLPDPAVVRAASAALVRQFGPDVTCALDMGVIEGGATACVELNDAWSVGLYGSALAPSAYFDFLATRWSQICKPAS